MNIKHLNVETLDMKYMQNISTEFYGFKMQLNLFQNIYVLAVYFMKLSRIAFIILIIPRKKI